MENKLLTAKEVAGIARVHTVTVRRWILMGKLSSIRIGGVRRIPVGALLDFLEESPMRRNPKAQEGNAA